MMMRKFLASATLFLSVSATVEGQSLRSAVGDMAAQVQAYSSRQSSLLSFPWNQASLAGIKTLAVGIYSEKRFFLGDVGVYRLALAAPVKDGCFGLSAAYFGNAGYRETGLGLAYGRKMGRVDLGLQFNYYGFAMASYGNFLSVNAEAGLLLRVTPGLNMGLHWYNPAGSSVLKPSSVELPSVFSAGLGYDASEKFFLGFDCRKENGMPVRMAVGMVYRPDEKLVVKAGCTSGTSFYYLGAGFVINGVFLESVASWHPYLGLTPGISICYIKPGP